MYEIRFDEKTIEYLNKLDKTLKKRIYDKIIKTKEDPFRYFVRLTERQYYKLRVGDYRVIADIDSSKNIVIITLIGHRKNVYE